MRDFWADLKNYFLQHITDGEFLYLPQYYETMLQNKENLTGIIDEYNNDDDWSFHYSEVENGYYHIGNLLIYNNNSKYSYELELVDEPHYDGYCECTSLMKDYNEKHDCCGTSCDWSKPAIDIKKITKLGYFNFTGIAKDLWTLTDKWEDDFEEVKRKKIESRINFLTQQIINLEQEREQLFDSYKPNYTA
jgi:hypothetical protein